MMVKKKYDEYKKKQPTFVYNIIDRDISLYNISYM